MDRRRFLTAAAGGMTAGVAGCLDLFETQSAWEQPPLVDDRPAAVYLPAAEEEMGTYAVESVGDLRVGVFFTFPHRFWVVTGEDDNLVNIGSDDVLHLMASVWHPETGLVPPAEIAAELSTDGDLVEQYQLWPMLSQRMGFHYGDNVELDGEGEYELELRMDPTSARTTGAAEGVFDDPVTTTVRFDYESSDVLDLEFDFIDTDRRGERGAVPLMIDEHGEHGDDMDHDGHDNDQGEHDDHDMDHNHEHPPPLQAPTVDALPGDTYDLGTTGDAEFVATILREGPRGEGQYLAVSPRTPHNRLSLPLMAMSASVERDGEVAEQTALRETLDDQLRHHYGAELSLAAGDEVTVTIDSPPQVSRHDGYETAFYGLTDRTFQVE